MEDRFFFNPYLFPGNYGFNGFPPNMTPPPNITANSSNVNVDNISPKEFYENGYYYYRYLNEMMDYQIKTKEFNEKFNKHPFNNNQNKNI